GLIAALADRRADWQLVMVGALDGIDPDRLPRRPNIHWLDAQAGGRAPYFAASWDVCLMPHAVGADTRAVCPTQALEFLAAEKPVVGTALPDVAHLFGRCIRVAHDHETFIAACIEAVAEDPAARPTERTLRARAMVGALSWRRCADRVQRLIDETVGLREPEPRPAGTSARWALSIDS
ncbi:MAG: glycosyltransferase, partial [Caldimonas sp.]